MQSGCWARCAYVLGCLPKLQVQDCLTRSHPRHKSPVHSRHSEQAILPVPTNASPSRGHPQQRPPSRRLIATRHRWARLQAFCRKGIPASRRKNSWVGTRSDIPGYLDNITYCVTNDGVSLAYAITGAGFPIVKVENWLSHVEYDWESPIWARFLRLLTQNNTLLRYDERGNGLSDWDVSEFVFDRLLCDLESVIDAAGFDKFILFGVSQDCTIAAAYAARHPERVVCQVLYGGYSRGWKKRNIPEEKEKRTAMTQLVRIEWGENNPAFRRIFASLFVPDASIEQIEWYTDLQSKTTSGKNAAKMEARDLKAEAYYHFSSPPKRHELPKADIV